MEKKKSKFSSRISGWLIRSVLGMKYEEKWRAKQQAENGGEEKKPDDSELIVTPARQIFERFMERKFAVFSVILVLFMFLVVFIGPLFMPKYSDSYTEVTLKNMPPNMSMTAVPKELKNDIKMIDSYGAFSVGLSNSGKVYVWGSTAVGATGIDLADIPQEVKDANIVLVAAGLDHIIAFGDDGKYYGWGSNRFAQYERTETVLENPNLEPVPEIIANGGIDVTQIKKLKCGYQATALLMNDGTLYVWGNKQAYSNMNWFIGKTNMVDVDFTLNYIVGVDSKQSSISVGVKGLYTTARTSVTGTGEKMMTFMKDRKIVEIAASTQSICMLLDDGTIAVTGDFLADSIEMPKLAADEKVISVESGNYHYTVLTDKGNVYSFGGDHYYQATVPEKLGKAAKVYTGAFQSYAVNDAGDLIGSWGLKGFIFGTDDKGADIFQRVIAGGRITMTVGAVAVIIEILIGVSLGCISGYFGGWVDMLIMRIAEVIGSLPLYPFMLILSSLLAQVSMTTEMRLFMIMVILGVLGWPGFAYLTRAQILVARESEYVTAAQAMGVKEGRIAFKHILPNIFSVILVNMTLSFAASMQTETSLSFLGFGVNYPQPSWGNMLSQASNATTAINFPWQWIFTSVILILTTVCINTIGDTLRDVMDPKSSNDK
ncbi:MAG: ABC transporter permease subunit [Clostridia bacterium]|nr:ABC transporter permease subunit [Clostridia bacterium]